MAKLKKKIRRKLRHIKKGISHPFSYFFIKTFIFFTQLFSIDTRMKILEFIGKIAYYIAISERKKIIANLNHAYGDEITPKQKREIAIGVFRNLGLSIAENIEIYKNGINSLKNRIKIIGFENAQTIFDNNSGLIAITGHLDNWELLAAYFSQNMNLNFGVIARRLKNTYLDKMLEEFRNKLKLKVFWREDSTRDLIKFLKKENDAILGLLADQNFQSSGLYIDFFGQSAFTPSGPAELIIFSKLPVLMVFIHRNPDKKTHTIEISKPLSISLTDNKEENIKNITNIYTKKIEEYIKKYPEQWMWMHLRWKLPK